MDTCDSIRDKFKFILGGYENINVQHWAVLFLITLDIQRYHQVWNSKLEILGARQLIFFRFQRYCTDNLTLRLEYVIPNFTILSFITNYSQK